MSDAEPSLQYILLHIMVHAFISIHTLAGTYQTPKCSKYKCLKLALINMELSLRKNLCHSMFQRVSWNTYQKLRPRNLKHQGLFKSDTRCFLWNLGRDSVLKVSQIFYDFEYLKILNVFLRNWTRDKENTAWCLKTNNDTFKFGTNDNNLFLTSKLQILHQCEKSLKLNV